MRCNAIVAATMIAGTLVASQADARTVYARTKLEKTGTPAAMHNPPCTAVEQAKNIGQQIIARSLDAIGRGAAQLGLGSDPFNTRRLNQSVCADLCVVVPTGAQFKAQGSITPHDWKGELPSGLPGTIDPENWAAVQGPAVETTPRGDVVCYTYKNWSHDTDRFVGLQVDYDE